MVCWYHMTSIQVCSVAGARARWQAKEIFRSRILSLFPFFHRTFYFLHIFRICDFIQSARERCVVIDLFIIIDGDDDDFVVDFFLLFLSTKIMIQTVTVFIFVRVYLC